MIVIHLARKPMPKGQSTVRTALDCGAGGLNIDACRVGVSRPGTRAGNFNSWRVLEGREDRCTTMNADERTSVGRWPANVILEHLPGCRCEGTREAKTTSSSGVQYRVRKGEGVFSNATGMMTPGRVSEIHGYGNEDGTETIEAWECVEGCPVAFLDFLSGPRSGSKPHWIKSTRSFEGWGTITQPNHFAGYADDGGASRFFKQVGGSE